MNQGIVLVLVIVLFFGIMYLYAYGTTGYKERLQEKRKRKKEEQAKLREAQMRKAREERLSALDMKYEAANERSREIRREIARLDAMKRERNA